MKRATQWISVTAVAAMLAVGCAAGEPQRSPGNQAGAPGSTTGDADACAIALGNVEGNMGTRGAGGVGTAPGGGAGTAGAGTEPTANGILIGNVALVALPIYDDMPTTGGPTGPATGTEQPGERAPAAGGTPGAALPGAPGMRAGTVLDRPGDTAGTGVGGAMERTGTVGIGPGAGTTGPTAVPGAPAAPGKTGAVGTAPGLFGAATTPGAPGAPAATGAPTALDRIRTACPRLAEIRVVNESGDRARLAEIAMSVRKGVAVTTFMDDIVRISRAADAVPAVLPGAAGAPAGGAPAGGAPAGGAPAGAAPGPVGAPAPGAFGTPPGTMGPGTTPPANR